MRIATGLALATVLLLPSTAFCQKKEMLEMNRDIALLQDEVRNLKKANEDRFAALDATMKQVLDQVTSINRQVGSLDKGVRDRVDKSIGSMGTKVDSLGEDFKSVRENVAEISEKLSTLQQKVSDLNNAIRTMQAPPPPPSGAASSGAPAANTPPAGLTAEGLYKDALRDKGASNYDIALKEFKDYLIFFADTDLAPNAQYYVGEIYYNQKNFDEAVKAFDAVLGMNGGKNNKSLDARFMKGRALVRLGEKSEGAKEFKAVVAASPNSDLARRAQAELRDLGAAAPTKKRR